MYNPSFGEVRLDCEPSPTWRPSTTLSAPFCNSPQAHVCIITILPDELPGCILAVPLETFRSHLHQVEPDLATSLAWDEWGPRGSRLLETDCQLVADLQVDILVYGTRFIAPVLEGEPEDEDDDPGVALVVYDFNRLAAKKAKTVDSEGAEPGGDTIMNVFDGPTVSSLSMFQHPVTTWLPYRRVLLPLGFDPEGLLIGEDGLVIIRVGRIFSRATLY